MIAHKGSKDLTMTKRLYRIENVDSGFVLGDYHGTDEDDAWEALCSSIAASGTVRDDSVRVYEVDCVACRLYQLAISAGGLY